MKQIHACALILVFVVFAISTQDDEIFSASFLSNSNSSGEVLFAFNGPAQTDYDSCLSTALDQMVNAHVTEVWLLRVEVNAGMAQSNVHAALSHGDVTVRAGRSPPATLAFTA